MVGVAVLQALPARIASKISVDESGCWMWNAYRNQLGYGTVRFDGRKWLAHRVTFTLLVGPIPEGLVLDHLCRNRGCVNPDHLRPCTQRENTHAPGSESIAVAHAARTHCPRGHAYAGRNLYVNPQGSRECRTCNGENTRRYRQRKAQW